MSDGAYLLLLGGMGIVTYLPRWLPLALLSRRTIPKWLAEWLDLVPAAILSALLLPEILTTAEPVRHFLFLQPKSIAALPTFIFAWKTRSLGGTVVVGMGLYWILEKAM